MKEIIRKTIENAIRSLSETEKATLSDIIFNVENSKEKGHGDFSTNIALVSAKKFGSSPRVIAQKLLPVLLDSALFENVEVAGPGFINFTLRGQQIFSVIKRVRRQGSAFGSNDVGTGKKVYIEFVSANPTGPLHVGHGRGAAIGSTLSRLYKFCGYGVCCEYYVNDSGRQMDILALSVYQRYLAKFSSSVGFSQNTYVGDYISRIAENLHKSGCAGFLKFENFSLTNTDELDVEDALDTVIADLKEFLGVENFRTLKEFSCELMLKEIKNTLDEFGVEFDEWCSEEELIKNGYVDEALSQLSSAGVFYKEDGATWFRSSDFGDEKDRVVIRDDGRYTYFATDIGHHFKKIGSDFARLINIWGADHHGYTARIRGALKAIDVDDSRLDFILVQFASLLKDGQKIAMSTRKGSFVTLDSLIDDVGVDASRFFYLIKKADQHMDFDIDLAKEKSAKNPVYYIQYAHARIASLLKHTTNLNRLKDYPDHIFEHELITESEREQALCISLFPEVINQSILTAEPSLIAQYLKDLAYLFHSNYAANQILVDDAALREARLQLAEATQQVFENGLVLLGISRPNKM